MDKKLLALGRLAPLPAHGPVFKTQGKTPRISGPHFQWPGWVRRSLHQKAQETWLPGYLQILLQNPYPHNKTLRS